MLIPTLYANILYDPVRATNSMKKHIQPIGTLLNRVISKMDEMYPKGGPEFIVKNETLKVGVSLGSPHIGMFEI